MRWIPPLEGDLKWRDVPAIIIWAVLIFTGMWLFDTIKNLGIWQMLADLPWWWQFAFRFGAMSITFGLYFIVIHGKWFRNGEVSLRKFLPGVAKISIIIGMLSAGVSFLPTWIFWSFVVIVFIIGYTSDQFQRRRENESTL